MQQRHFIQFVPAACLAVCGWFACASAFAVDLGPWSNCYIEAGKTYGRDPLLYFSIAQVESSGCRNLIHRNADGTHDIGCMQINSSAMPFLQQYGITEDRLLTDPCLNIHVGAWILETKVRRFGPTWEAVGAYNAACSKLKGRDCIAVRMKYIRKVAAAYNARLEGAGTPISGARDRKANPGSEPPQLQMSGD
ncbi:transglycosylase SLT domain-containing protein [Burkholderia gladioli]|uniref:Transglycosylase SLT domain-containing protein n=1 Tax=Burkholderia gladioli TaxID=28095 RepID=A0A2A7S9P7_BURGA|nr:lytic transglycosylase domain-containing protein [Burkholderia gladioli]PEH40424.1 transglycosylase SLT domain-containing protein [Burkholderia gladioli]